MYRGLWQPTSCVCRLTVCVHKANWKITVLLPRNLPSSHLGALSLPTARQSFRTPSTKLERARNWGESAAAIVFWPIWNCLAPYYLIYKVGQPPPKIAFFHLCCGFWEGVMKSERMRESGVGYWLTLSLLFNRILREWKRWKRGGGGVTNKSIQSVNGLRYQGDISWP